MKNSIKILVCNENREERERLVQYLSTSGYGACDEARDGDTALDYISRGKYDVVITDLWVSGIDGIGIIRQTKLLELKDTPSFILTSPPPSTSNPFLSRHQRQAPTSVFQSHTIWLR